MTPINPNVNKVSAFKSNTKKNENHNVQFVILQNLQNRRRIRVKCFKSTDNQMKWEIANRMNECLKTEDEGRERERERERDGRRLTADIMQSKTHSVVCPKCQRGRPYEFHGTSLPYSSFY